MTHKSSYSAEFKQEFEFFLQDEEVHGSFSSVYPKRDQHSATKTI
jgi:hypothetical protein